MDMGERAKRISEAVQGLKYCDWSRIRVAVEKRYSQESVKVVLDNSQELECAIMREF